jgi:cupin fold WbuC family metalloprotein|tara:strand:+ start:9557 stop:9982 length:426 start_codon:yes stop_codon:yes gene_type:complete
MIKQIHSKIDGRLLHLINRFDGIVDRTNVAPEDQFIQLATLRMDKGKTFRPHQHIWKPAPREKVIAQESWVIIQGSVTIHMYDTDGTHIGDETINKGDCSMTFEGGHTYTINEDDTVVYEYKTGPYTGVENDKVFIEDHRE